MRNFKILLGVTMVCLMGSSLYADIYEWTDKNGVRNFTNHTPPDNAMIIMKTEELPYDEAADQARMEAEKLASLEHLRQKIAEKEAALEQREAEAERNFAEASRQAEETLKEAEELVDEAGSERFNSRYFGDDGYASGIYSYSYPYYDRRYYRGYRGGIHIKKFHQYRTFSHKSFRNNRRFTHKVDHFNGRFKSHGRHIQGRSHFNGRFKSHGRHIQGRSHFNGRFKSHGRHFRGHRGSSRGIVGFRH
jgi:flavodoxin